jgi:hypothetical protein
MSRSALATVDHDPGTELFLGAKVSQGALPTVVRIEGPGGRSIGVKLAKDGIDFAEEVLAVLLRIGGLVVWAPVEQFLGPEMHNVTQDLYRVIEVVCDNNRSYESAGNVARELNKNVGMSDEALTLAVPHKVYKAHSRQSARRDHFRTHPRNAQFRRK